MNIDQSKKILMLGGEGQNIEFKRDCQDIDSIGKVICGFLNSSGGSILCGISENFNLTGIKITESEKNNIEKEIQQHISPKALVSFDVNEIEGKKILVIEVPAGKDIPYAFQDVIYIRNENKTQKADIYTINDMVLSKQVEPHRWERRFSIADINEDIELNEFNQAIKEISKRFNFRDNHNMNMVLEDLSVARYGRLTNAGDILFCKNPAERCPQVRVRASCYISDKYDEVYNDFKSFEGPLIRVLEELFHFIQRNTATKSLFSRDDLRRQDKSVYPADAIREGLVNAFVHRDYSDFSGGIIVSVYPKSLEIYNTGSFPEGVTPDKLSEGHISVLRNPDIAHVVYLRGLMEKNGRGSVLIRRSCEEHGLPLPKWTSDQNSVTLTFFAPEEKKVSETRIQIGGMPWVHTIIQTTDGGFLIGGSYSDSESFPHSRPWVAKTDDNGSLLWENKFGSVNDSFIGFYESEDGKYHIIYAPQLTGENGPDRDQYIETVIDNNGKLASTNNDNVPGYPKLISKDGLVFTETISCTDGGKKLHIIKTNAEGETEWDSLCELADSSATGSSIGSGIVRTADGGYLITGARYYY